MATSVTKRALEGLGLAVSETYADGRLQAGESVSINGYQYFIGVQDVSSDFAFDRFLESRVGGKVDILADSWGNLQYLVTRGSSTGTRVVNAVGSDQAPDNPYYRNRPSYSDLSARYQAQAGACGWFDSYCTTSLASQYGQLSASLSAYIAVYDSFAVTHANFVGKGVVTSYDVQAYIGAVRSASVALSSYYQFYGVTPPPYVVIDPIIIIPDPVPYYDPAPYVPTYPRNPDNDDWSIPSYPSYPQNPDNDDWSVPSYPSYPQNPDNDDWGGYSSPSYPSPGYEDWSSGSQEDKDW